MRRAGTRRVVLALAVLAVAACEPPGRTGQLDIAVSPTPAAVGAAQVRVTLSPAGGGGDLVGPVVVTGRMEDGSAAPVVDTAAAVRDGLWVVDDFPFSAPGDWTLEARAGGPDGGYLGRHRIRVVGR